MKDLAPTGTTPLLTIAIPTWNRAGYLEVNLSQLRTELEGVASGTVEVLVSDNCSPDATGEVVERARQAGLPVRYVRNDKNVGWALNFAQAYDLATGKHVLLMSDDDLFVDGALTLLLDRLRQGAHGVVCLRPYGYDNDFRSEFPGGDGRERVFSDANEFLVAISRYFTLTSALVLNKMLLASVDVRAFILTDLATFHLVLRAALAAKSNLYVEKYLIASKRQNSASYEFAEIFVSQFWRIVDAQQQHGLHAETIRRLERRRLVTYYPFYLLDLRRSRPEHLDAARRRFADRFGRSLLFRLWLAPILNLPRAPAIVWGSLAMAIGRVLDGDFRRGLKFVLNRVGRPLKDTPGHLRRFKVAAPRSSGQAGSR